jgi:hypothetical protein
VAFASAIFSASFGIAGNTHAQGLGAPVQVMDPKAGMPIFVISLPQGWTHGFDSTWDRRASPFVNFRFSARSPDGIEAYTILPAQETKTAVSPSRFGRSFIEQNKKNNPRVAALNYRIVEAKDYPVSAQEQAQAAQRNMRLAKGGIRSEYTENGVAKTEMMSIQVLSGGSGIGSAHLVTMEAISGRRGDDTLARKMIAITNSRRMNPQWEQRYAAMTQQYLAENSRDIQASLANQQAQWKTLQAQQQAQGEAMRQQMDARIKEQDAARAAIRERSETWDAARGRVSERQTDAIAGRDNRENPYDGTQFKSDVNTEHVWVNKDNKAIGANDSTYNPNYDSSRSGDWKLAPKGY